jgi:hypothetical protein
MDIVQKELIKTDNGWRTVFLIQLNPEELTKIENSNKNLLKYFKGYEISVEDNFITLSRNFKIMEPWEDETPEAIIKSVQMEIEHRFRKIMDMN